jgi:putative heme iron utilization protein
MGRGIWSNHTPKDDDHKADIIRLRERAEQFEMRDRLVYHAAADLLEAHDAGTELLEEWDNGRDLVELLIGRNLRENED